MADRSILLVEGVDDEHVVRHICQNRTLPLPDEIRQCGGASKLLVSITDQLRASTGQNHIVGVVIDADRDFDARRQAVLDRFHQVGYRGLVPALNANGTVIQPPNDSPLPRAGIWIMPDNSRQGSLEEFLRSLVPAHDQLFVHSEDVVDHLPERRFISDDRLKAVMHTWLAWQSDPGWPYGTSITAGFLDASLPQASVLVDWLQRLFHRPEDSP